MNGQVTSGSLASNLTWLMMRQAEPMASTVVRYGRFRWT